MVTPEGSTLITHQAVRTGIRAAAVAVLAAALLPVLGAGPAAAASDITFSGVPALGVPGQIYTLLAIGVDTTITASTNSSTCEVIDQDNDEAGTDLISVAVDLGDVEQAPGTCAITATDSTGSATATFDTEGQDAVDFISSPPSPALAGGTYLVQAFSFSGHPVTFSIASSSTDNCTVGPSDGLEATVTFGTTAGTCVIDAATASEDSWVGASASQTVHVLLQDTITLSQASEPQQVNGSYTIIASDLSANPVTFSIASSSTNSCSVASTGTDQALVSFGPSPGSCTADAATAAGNGYAAASASETVTVVPTQAVTFTSSPPSPALVGGTYAATASATTSDGPPDTPGTVTITVDSASTPGACSVVGGSAGLATVSLSGPGTCTLDATAATSSSDAPSVTTEQSFAVLGVVTVQVSGSQAYGSSSPTFNYTDDAPGGISLAGTLSCTEVGAGTAISASLTTGSYSPDGASCGGLSLNGPGASGYSISYAGVSDGFIVSPAPLSITASSPAMTYGGAVPAITPTYSGFVNGDTAASLTTAPSCSTTATSSSPVGSYPSTCSGAVDANYAINYTAGSVSIGPAPLSITASSPAMTYGGAVPAITPIYSGLVAGDTAASLPTPPTCSTTATSSSPPGSYPSTCSGAVDANYDISYNPGSVSVGTTVLTITATSATMAYGGAVPAITALYRGFADGDSPASLTTAPTCATAATSSSPPGTYSATCSGAVDPNYAIGYVAGTVTVAPATLTVTASSATFTQGGAVPAIAPSYAGFVNGDNGRLAHHRPQLLDHRHQLVAAGHLPLDVHRSRGRQLRHQLYGRHGNSHRRPGLRRGANPERYDHHHNVTAGGGLPRRRPHLPGRGHSQFRGQ